MANLFALTKYLSRTGDHLASLNGLAAGLEKAYMFAIIINLRLQMVNMLTGTGDQGDNPRCGVLHW